MGIADEVLAATRWTYPLVLARLGDEADEFDGLMRNPEAHTERLRKALLARGVLVPWVTVERWRERLNASQ